MPCSAPGRIRLKLLSVGADGTWEGRRRGAGAVQGQEVTLDPSLGAVASPRELGGGMGCSQAAFSLLLHTKRCSQVLLFCSNPPNVKEKLPLLGTLSLCCQSRADFVLVLMGFPGVLQEKSCRIRWEHREDFV